MILIIDNYDSFVYNLDRYVQLCGMQTYTVRNDKISVSECLALRPLGVILSPGPKVPSDAGICLELLSALSLSVPLLGVCLGHQCLVERFGGSTLKAITPMHGQSSPILHSGEGILEGVPTPLSVGRYHSLVSHLPDHVGALEVTAHSTEAEIMAVQHKSAPWFGVQFHPESVLTPEGFKMIETFVAICCD